MRSVSHFRKIKTQCQGTKIQKRKDKKGYYLNQ